MPKKGQYKHDKQLLIASARYVGLDPQPEYCEYPNCAKPGYRVALCTAHYASWCRVKPIRNKRPRPDFTKVLPYVQPPRHWTAMKASEMHCHYPNCKGKYASRGLCKKHENWFGTYCNENGIDRATYRA